MICTYPCSLNHTAWKEIGVQPVPDLLPYAGLSRSTARHWKFPLTASPPAEEEFIARRSKSPRLVELLRPEHLLVGLQKLLARFAGEGLG